jgi:anti-sigma regulatory factor (Ser/Thr protein kinase)
MALKTLLLREGGRPVEAGDAASYSIRVPAIAACLPMLRTAVWSFLAKHLDDRAIIDRIGFSVSEAVNNAILHAYPDGTAGQVDITLMHLGTEVDAVIRDYGVGVQRDIAPKPRLGIPLMAKMASTLEIAEAAPGTVVRQRFQVDDPQV